MNPNPALGHLPFLQQIFDCNPLSLNKTGCGFQSAPTVSTSITWFVSLGNTVSNVLILIFAIAAFLAFFWLIWGAFQYLFAGGDKEGLAKARARITWAIVGLIFVFLAFILTQFIAQILQPTHTPPLSFLAQPVYAQGTMPLTFPRAEDITIIYDFGKISSLGQGVNLLVVPAFAIAAIAVIIYFIIGAIRFLASGGDKENIAKARKMITHAMIGFLLLIFIFLTLEFIPQFLGVKFALF